MLQKDGLEKCIVQEDELEGARYGKKRNQKKENYEPRTIRYLGKTKERKKTKENKEDRARRKNVLLNKYSLCCLKKLLKEEKKSLNG